MIRQEQTVHQHYWDSREKRHRIRPVRQFHRVKLELAGSPVKLPKRKKAGLASLIASVFKRAA